MEIVLTKQTCIPGTRVVPSQYLIATSPDYVNAKGRWSNEKVKTIGTIMGYEEPLVILYWDNIPKDKHSLGFEQLALYNPYPESSIDQVFIALDKLEIKLL